MYNPQPQVNPNLDEFAGDRHQNLKTSFAQAPEQSEFTYSAHLLAAGQGTFQPNPTRFWFL